MVEIELKYAIPNKGIAEIIWQDADLVKIEEAGSREKLTFKATYFDTDDCILAANDVAFRVRLEGTRLVAALKWSGKSEGPLHTRNEINVPIDGEACLIMPDPAIFSESQIGRQMLALIGGRPLTGLMEVRFLRRRIRVDAGSSIIEVSIDVGEIASDNGTEPICELELELFSGEQSQLIALGEKLARRYSLVPEGRSKYARGLALGGKAVLGK